MAGLSEGDQEKVSLFVDEMRAMREQRGWSRAELARETNYSESLIAMVETYQRAPTLTLAKGLDRAFQTPGFTEGTGDDPGTPGTFVRLWHKLRTVSFPASFRSFVEHEEKAAELRRTSTRWCPACSRPRTTRGPRCPGSPSRLMSR